MCICRACKKEFEERKDHSSNVFCSRKCWFNRYKRILKKGEVFNRWTVLYLYPDLLNKKRKYMCKCECGTGRIVAEASLIYGRSKSCGCWKREVDIARHYIHGQSFNRIYNIWKDMRRRCSSLKSSSYRFYGAKGISVCGEWDNSFNVFWRWAKENGYKDTMEIDRTDNNGNYEPSNCKFLTRSEHNRKHHPLIK